MIEVKHSWKRDSKKILSLNSDKLYKGSLRVEKSQGLMLKRIENDYEMPISIRKYHILQD